MAVYDINNRKSFESIEDQILNFIDYTSQDIARNIILVGAKSDVIGKRKVEFSEAVDLGRKLKLSACFETSAKADNNVDIVFKRAICDILDFGVDYSEMT